MQLSQISVDYFFNKSALKAQALRKSMFKVEQIITATQLIRSFREVSEVFGRQAATAAHLTKNLGDFS